MPTSKLRLLPVLLLVLFLVTGLRAEVSPARLLLLRGAISLGEGQAARAVADLSDAATLNPEDWRCQLLYGQALLQVGQRELATAQLRRATLLAPLNPEPWRALLRAAREMQDIHLEVAAIAGLQRLMPEDPQLLRRLAEIYRTAGRTADADRLDAQWQANLPPLKLDYRFTVGDHDASLAELRLLAQAETTNRVILSALATEEWRAGNPAAAREAMRKLCVDSPMDPEMVSGYTHLCLLTGQVDTALEALRRAGPGTAAMDRALVLWSLSAGQYREALEPLDRLLQQNVIDADLNRLIGFAQSMVGNTGAACAAFRIAWLRAHDHLSAQHYAAALQADGHADEAEDVLTRAREMAPAESALGLQLSLLYRDTNRLSQCAELTAALARVRPENVELYLLAGERFFRAGYIQRVYQMAATLRDAFPKDEAAMCGAVILFHRLAARDEARMTLTRYLGPNFPPPAPPAEILLLVAQYAMADNKFANAVMALEDAIKRAPDCREAYQQLGKLQQQQSDWNAAARVYQRALAQWPNDPEFTLAQARVAWQAGNFPQAMLLYRQAAAVLPTADPLLELGTLYYRQGDEAQARASWETALARRGGQVRARLSLLASYEHHGDTDRVLKMKEELQVILANERAARAASWRPLIAAAGLQATSEEIDALLLMEPDLTDPAPLEVPTPAPEPLPAEPVINPPAEPTDNPPTQPVANPLAEPTDNPPAEPVANPPTEPDDNPPAEPVANPPTEPADNPPAEPVANPPAEPADNPPTEPTTNPPAVPADNPPTEPAPADTE